MYLNFFVLILFSFLGPTYWCNIWCHLDCDIWFIWSIRAPKPQRSSSRHMVSSVIWFNTAWLATCMNCWKHWDSNMLGIRTVVVLWLYTTCSHFIYFCIFYYTYACHIYEIVLYFYHSESKKLYFYMNSKFLHSNRQGNVEAWELVSFSLKSFDNLL